MAFDHPHFRVSDGHNVRPIVSHHDIRGPAGTVGAALCKRFLELRWIESRPNTRALTITNKGLRGFAETFGLRLSEERGREVERVNEFEI
jgi:hypothetical protein